MAASTAVGGDSWMYEPSNTNSNRRAVSRHCGGVRSLSTAVAYAMAPPRTLSGTLFSNSGAVSRARDCSTRFAKAIELRVGHALIVPKSEHAPNDCTPYSVRVPAALAPLCAVSTHRFFPEPCASLLRNVSEAQSVFLGTGDYISSPVSSARELGGIRTASRGGPPRRRGRRLRDTHRVPRSGSGKGDRSRTRIE